MLRLGAEPRWAERREADTQAALARGVFGAPSYVIGDDIFWGQDRLEFVGQAARAGWWPRACPKASPASRSGGGRMRGSSPAPAAITADLAVPGALHLHVAALAACARAHPRRRAARRPRHARRARWSSPAPTSRAAGLGPLPCPAVVNTIGPLIVPERHALARDARAPSRRAGGLRRRGHARRRRATRPRRSTVAYEPLPAVVDSRAALAPGAPQVWEQAPGNQAFRFERGDRAAVEAAFARAAHVVSLDLVNQRLHAAPIEPRAAIGRHDAATATAFRPRAERPGRPHHPRPARRRRAPRARRARPPVLPRCRRRLRPEELPLPGTRAGAARRAPARPPGALGRGAARRSSRRAVHARDFQGTARLALDAEGRFLALHADMVADLGAYCSAFGPACRPTPSRRDGRRSTPSRPCCWRCAAPSPTPCPSTPIAAPASRKPTT